MKRRVLTSLALLTLAITAFSQTELPNDSVKGVPRIQPAGKQP